MHLIWTLVVVARFTTTGAGTPQWSVPPLIFGLEPPTRYVPAGSSSENPSALVDAVCQRLPDEATAVSAPPRCSVGRVTLAVRRVVVR